MQINVQSEFFRPTFSPCRDLASTQVLPRLLSRPTYTPAKFPKRLCGIFSYFIWLWSTFQSQNKRVFFVAPARIFSVFRTFLQPKCNQKQSCNQNATTQKAILLHKTGLFRAEDATLTANRSFLFLQRSPAASSDPFDLTYN